MKVTVTAALAALAIWQAAGAHAQGGSAADFRSAASSDTESVVHSEVTHSDQVDTVAVTGSSTPQPNWGFGGTFTGGFVGVEGRAELSGPGIRYGVRSTATGGALENYGVFGDTVGPPGSTNFGVWGSSGGNDSFDYGVIGHTSCSGACTTYGVYASGDLAYTGALIDASDLKLKENVTASEGTLSSLMEIEVVTYEHSTKRDFAHMSLPKGPQIGFIAQQVAEVLPDLVTDAVHPAKSDLHGAKFAIRTEEEQPVHYKAIKPLQMIPILVKAVQEQQALIEELQSQIGILQNRLATLPQDQTEQTLATLSP